MAGLFSYPKFKAFDTNGIPLVGGLLYTYAAGTTTPATTYTDRSLTAPYANTNPIVLDSMGEAIIWSDQQLKFVLHDASDSPIWTVDYISIGGVSLPLAIGSGGTGATTTAAARSALGLGAFSTYVPVANTVLYVSNTGAISTVALGAAGTALVSTGATTAPVFSASGSSSFTYTDAQYIGAI